MLILIRDSGWGCTCATSLGDLDLTSDHAVVTVSFKILVGLCLSNCRVEEVGTW